MREKMREKTKFVPKTLDFELSPYTGLTRESWLEAGRYMLEGIFQNIDDFEKPVIMPRKETEITYPHLRDPEEAQHTQRLAEVFEGLTRSFFIAAPMISLPVLRRRATASRIADFFVYPKDETNRIPSEYRAILI